MSRCNNTLASSVSKSNCLSTATVLGLLVASNKPCSSALAAPVRTKSVRPRLPANKLTASIMIDLPAPVSPVNAVMPVSKLNSKWSIIAKSWITNSCNIASPNHRVDHFKHFFGLSSPATYDQNRSIACDRGKNALIM